MRNQNPKHCLYVLLLSAARPPSAFHFSPLSTQTSRFWDKGKAPDRPGSATSLIITLSCSRRRRREGVRADNSPGRRRYEIIEQRAQWLRHGQNCVLLTLTTTLTVTAIHKWQIQRILRRTPVNEYLRFCCDYSVGRGPIFLYPIQPSQLCYPHEPPNLIRGNTLSTFPLFVIRAMKKTAEE